MLIEFHPSFSFLIKYYHIIFIIIVFWLGCDRPSGLLFFLVSCASFHTHAYVLSFFVCFFVLFRYLLFPCKNEIRQRSSPCYNVARTQVPDFPTSYSHAEWYLPYFARRNRLVWAESSSIKIILIKLNEAWAIEKWKIFHPPLIWSIRPAPRPRQSIGCDPSFDLCRYQKWLISLAVFDTDTFYDIWIHILFTYLQFVWFHI